MAADWSFNRTGPFYKLQRHLGLLDEDNLRAGRRAVLFALLAFVPLLLLAWPQGMALNEQHQRALLYDFSAYAIVVAIIAFVLMEQTSDRRMAMLIRQVATQGLVTPGTEPCLQRARLAMERRTGAWWVEALLLVAAFWVA